MSSRVQKGNTIFRPVAKSRPRTTNSASRQPSVAVDQSHSTTPDSILGQNIPSSSSSSTEKNSETPLAPAEVLSDVTTSVENDKSSVNPEGIPSQESIAARPVKATVIGIPIRPVQRSQATPITTSGGSSSTVTPIHNPVQANSSSPASVAHSLPSDKPAVAHASPQDSVPTEERTTDGVAASRTTEESSAGPSQSLAADEDAEGSTRSKRGTSKRKKSQKEPAKKRKKRKSEEKDGQDRAPSPPPYDPDADPGEDIDPTTVTMASLCSDTGQGRVSSKAAEIMSNHAAWKAKNREKRARMKALMEAKKYGREDEENAEQGPEQGADPSTSTDVPNTSAATSTPAVVDDTDNGFDYSQDLTTSRYNVQVRIGANGAMVIDEESLVVDRVEDDGTEDYTHVIESDHTKFVNSGTYGKRYRGSRWSAEETELFYDALSQYGENYELIAYVLPGRDRKACKNKFKVEDKRNHARINHCLENSIRVDMKTLSRMTGKDFSGPVPEIRVPTPPRIVPSEETAPAAEEETSTQPVKKRSRSRVNANNDGGLVVIGDAADFES
ncbi:hypothetical protein CPC08DRAFT_710445 [Agrocybe pediades]|nr:hypothetical protein CPC08DRAFT_710445 [Agrocybe pediades]